MEISHWLTPTGDGVGTHITAAVRASLYHPGTEATVHVPFRYLRAYNMQSTSGVPDEKYDQIALMMDRYSSLRNALPKAVNNDTDIEGSDAESLFDSAMRRAMQTALTPIAQYLLSTPDVGRLHGAEATSIEFALSNIASLKKAIMAVWFTSVDASTWDVCSAGIAEKLSAFKDVIALKEEIASLQRDVATRVPINAGVYNFISSLRGLKSGADIKKYVDLAVGFGSFQYDLKKSEVFDLNSMRAQIALSLSYLIDDFSGDPDRMDNIDDFRDALMKHQIVGINIPYYEGSDNIEPQFPLFIQEMMYGEMQRMIREGYKSRFYSMFTNLWSIQFRDLPKSEYQSTFTLVRSLCLLYELHLMGVSTLITHFEMAVKSYVKGDSNIDQFLTGSTPPSYIYPIEQVEDILMVTKQWANVCKALRAMATTRESAIARAAAPEIAQIGDVSLILPGGLGAVTTIPIRVENYDISKLKDKPIAMSNRSLSSASRGSFLDLKTGDASIFVLPTDLQVDKSSARSVSDRIRVWNRHLALQQKTPFLKPDYFIKEQRTWVEFKEYKDTFFDSNVLALYLTIPVNYTDPDSYSRWFTMESYFTQVSFSGFEEAAAFFGVDSEMLETMKEIHMIENQYGSYLVPKPWYAIYTRASDLGAPFLYHVMAHLLSMASFAYEIADSVPLITERFINVSVASRIESSSPAVLANPSNAAPVDEVLGTTSSGGLPETDPSDLSGDPDSSESESPSTEELAKPAPAKPVAKKTKASTANPLQSQQAGEGTEQGEDNPNKDPNAGQEQSQL